MRGVAGVVAGIAVMLLARFVPGDNLLLGISCTLGIAILAGFVTALISGRNEFRYVGMLGVGMVAIAAIGMIQRGARQPAWSEIAVGGCGPMAAFVGAGLRLLTRPRIL